MEAEKSKIPPGVLERRIIPALRGLADLPLALELGMPVVIMLKGDIFDLGRLTEQTAGRLSVWLHLDLIEGVGRDKPGLLYLKQQFGVAGIVSTRSNLVKDARSLGLVSILRLFALDSAAYTTGLSLLNSLKPDAVEMLPGVVVPFIKEDLAQDVRQPIIASGLIKTAQTVQAVLEAGAAAVSTSRPELWKLRPV